MAKIELAINNVDPEKGEGEILTTPTTSPFISIDCKYVVNKFCLIMGVSSESTNQIFLCLLDEDFGTGSFENSEVGIIVTAIDKSKIEFAFFGQMQIDDDKDYLCFSPINPRNPDLEVMVDDFSFGVSDPQLSINSKWLKLATIPINKIQIKGSSDIRDFIPNPESSIFPPQDLFIEHLKSLFETGYSPIEP